MVHQGQGWWWSCSFFTLSWSAGLTSATILRRYCWRPLLTCWTHSFEEFFDLPPFLLPFTPQEQKEEVIGVRIAFQMAEKVKVRLSIAKLVHFQFKALTVRIFLLQSVLYGCYGLFDWEILWYAHLLLLCSFFRPCLTLRRSLTFREQTWQVALATPSQQNWIILGWVLTYLGRWLVQRCSMSLGVVTDELPFPTRRLMIWDRVQS